MLSSTREQLESDFEIGTLNSKCCTRIFKEDKQKYHNLLNN